MDFLAFQRQNSTFVRLLPPLTRAHVPVEIASTRVVLETCSQTTWCTYSYSLSGIWIQGTVQSVSDLNHLDHCLLRWCLFHVLLSLKGAVCDSNPIHL